VKIAEGCNHPCSFCIIPRMRGSHRSRAQADIVREARQLIAEGVKEFEPDFTGLDLLRPGPAPEPLARHRVAGKFSRRRAIVARRCHNPVHAVAQLNELPGIFWIRLLYTHPAHWTTS